MEDVIKLINKLLSKVECGEITQSDLEQELASIVIELEGLQPSFLDQMNED